MTTFTVTIATDESDGDLSIGDLSLREAIAIASAGDTINFDASLSGAELRLTMGELVLTSDITIDGDIDGDDRADIVISGDADGSGFANEGDSRIFTISGTEATIRSLALTDGYADKGGAIKIENGASLDLVDSTVYRNTSLGAGGGIYNAGTLQATNVTLVANYALGQSGLGSGGAIYFAGTSFDNTLVNTTVYSNIADYSGGALPSPSAPTSASPTARSPATTPPATAAASMSTPDRRSRSSTRSFPETALPRAPTSPRPDRNPAPSLPPTASSARRSASTPTTAATSTAAAAPGLPSSPTTAARCRPCRSCRAAS
ncbi:hypothetical protein [Methylobrevis pamukkalensis]|uniref:Right handed beta helix domain-containing protein n=1 Tax=Methylobrevis pamukkalensis TaxID=1439726 RepID=A0A1E3H1B9_9HYPH|nr:hypothetical protein [Methylobrevis pamukkalensis]ODN70128.1 hypothetical protein A6302_02550 [Methylobrevis pamukkalensis]